MPRSMRRVLEMMRSFALCTLSLTTALATIAGAQTGADSVRTPFGSVRAIERPYNVSRFDLPANNSALPVANLSQLLSGRFAGVQVLSGGATGTGSRIRIRGQSSMLLGNEPLIIVDGVRLVQTLNASTQMPSRVDDINVDDIARVEIINGPSGTTIMAARQRTASSTSRRNVAWRARLRSAYTRKTEL